MEPREFVDQELKVIEEIFRVQKEIYPMVVLVKDNDRYQIPISYQNTAHKDIVSQGIKDLVKKSEPDIVIYVAEAWAKILNSKEDRIPLAGISTDPNRYEIIIVQIEFKSGEKFGAEARIIRESGDVKLAPFRIMDTNHSMGRFVDFFPIKRTN